MKFASRIVFFVLLLATLGFAQDQSKKMVSVPEDQLTEQQKAALKLNQIDQTVEKAHGWVGVGKEIGQAIDSSLAAITTRSNEFADTKVGKFTMFLVAWKVMGEQAGAVLNAIVHFLYGFVELAFFFPIILWSYRRNCLPRRIVTAVEGPFWSRKKTYTILQPELDSQGRPDAERLDAAKWTHFALFLIFTLVFLVTVFTY